MDLIEDDVAHDRHPEEGGQEAEHVDVPEHHAQRRHVQVVGVSLDNDEREEGEHQGHREVQHDLVVVRPNHEAMSILEEVYAISH